jgi:secreted protein with Ig-like and vWFA domain
MRARFSLVPVLLSLLALAAAGCGSGKDTSTPVACLEGSGAYLKALAAAPGEVTLADETPISDCLAENQQGGDLATVGEALVAAATKLNAEARAEPGNQANVQLGYLLGAAERGAERTEGIHSDLLRRLTVAARYSPHPPLPAAFQRAYREGFEAGRDHG